MKKTLFTWLIMLVTCQTIYSQLPQKAMGIPGFLDGFYPQKSAEKKIRNNEFSDQIQSFWVVWSDKFDNTTYTSKGGSREMTSLEFLERVTIAEVADGWAHVYVEEYSTKWPSISAKAKDKGWIKIENLILSEYCLTNENTFTRKGMVLTTVGSGENNVNTANQFFSDPLLKNKTTNFAKTFEIYFIYKETPTAYLLAKADKLKGSTDEIRGNILGWMSKGNVTSWDSRVCLEANWKPEANIEYNGVPFSVFIDKDQAINNKQNGTIEKAIRSIILKGKRDDGYTMRMPIISTDGNFKKVGTIGYITALDEQKEAKLRKLLQEIINKIEHVNILFVIDGTKSMEQFYQPVSQAISASVSKLKAKDSQNKIKFGAAIYRDYADGKNAIEIKQMTSKFEDITGFINGIKCGGLDTDLPEAVFNGLIQGIDKCGFKDGESNIIVFIGDAGNHVPDTKGNKIEQVIKLMTRYQCSMVGFQVNNGRDITYDYFIDHLRDMLYKTASNLLSNNNLNPNLIKWIQLNNNTYKIDIEDKRNSEDNDILVVGRFIFASKGGSMSVIELEKAIEKTIEDYDERVNKIKAMLESALNRIGGEFTLEFQTWLINQGFSKKDIDALKKCGGIRVEGWVTDKIDGKTNNIALPVVFMSREEFTTLIERCKLVDMGGNGPERRYRMQTALMQVCRSIIGDPNANIESKTLNEIWKLLLDIPFYDTKIGSIRLRDVTDQTIFNDDLFNEFHQRFKNKLDNIKQYTSQVYPYNFESNGITFYWIPLEDLP